MLKQDFVRFCYIGLHRKYYAKVPKHVACLRRSVLQVGMVDDEREQADWSIFLPCFHGIALDAALRGISDTSSALSQNVESTDFTPSANSRVAVIKLTTRYPTLGKS